MLLLLHPTADDLCQARPATFDLGVALPPLAASCYRPFPWVREALSLVRGLMPVDALLFAISIVSLGPSNLEPRAQVGRLCGCASHLSHFGSSRMFRDSPSTITPGDHGSMKFHYHRRVSDKFASTTTSHDDLVPLPSQEPRPVSPKTQVP